MAETIERPIKRTFTATDADGNKYRWAFWFDSGYRAWFLRDPDGYERRMEETWAASVPRIRMVLGNYGVEAEIN